MSEPPHPTIEDRRIAGVTMAVGAAIIAFLTHYNLTGYSVYSPGLGQGFHSWDEYLVVNCSGLVLLPFLAVFGVFRADAREFGFRPAERGSGRAAWWLFIAMIPVMVVASRYPTFNLHYPMYPPAAFSWPALAAFELTYGFYFFCWEWFYRGFLTFGLAKGLGFPLAIFIQAVGFGIMHVGKPMPEVIGSFAGGIVLGALAMRSRSFYPCFLLHWAVSVSFDLLVIQARPGGLF